MQLKSNPLQNCQLKFSSDDKTGEFEGYASVFNSVDLVGDTILPGAFGKSLGGSRMPSMFVNHDHGSVPVGDWKDLKEDDYGLFGVGQIDLNHKDGPTVYSAMKRGAMDGLSIGFNMSEGDFDLKKDGGRNIKNMLLREVSIVTFPCEESARIGSVKAEDVMFSSLKDAEIWLRESFGFSRSAATKFVGRILEMSRSESGAHKDEPQMSEFVKYLRRSFK